MPKVEIHLEFTPNPNTLKFVLSEKLLDKGAVNFTAKDKAEESSPLANNLFEVPGVTGVLLGTNFVTITKAATGDWDVLAEKVPQAIETFFSNGTKVFVDGFNPTPVQTSGAPETEVERKIKEVLDQEIRPAVAMDGGDIVFNRYEEGIVYLQLQGSCSSCPSSIATLKMGVETRLKEVIPEIKEVVQV